MPPREHPTFKDRLEYAGLYAVFLLSRIVPRHAFVKLGSAIGRFVFDGLKIRREVALANLRFVFGSTKSESEIVDLARRSYGQLGGSLLEFSSLYTLTPEQLRETVEIVDLHYIDEVVASGRGCMLVAGHFGNWELCGAAFAARGYKTTFLMREQSNPLASRMQNLLRARGGIEIVKDGPLVARGVLRAIREGHLVGILPDQDAGRHGVFVDFLGRPASTFKGPAFFAHRANVPIVISFIRRQPDGNHIATILEPIYPDPSRPQEEEIQRLTQIYTDLMSEWIRRYPENYFWVHRRWKTQPPGAAPVGGATGPAS